MPEINFYLKSVQADKKGLVPIIAQINLDYKKYRKAVDKTKKRHWNKNKQKYIVKIFINYKKIYLGLYETKEECSIIRAIAEQEFWDKKL